MRTTVNYGLTVWDLDTDEFDHTQLSSNWDTIDANLGAAATQFQTVSSLPTSGNFAGRIVMLNAAAGGFAAYTLVRFDGVAWKPINQVEIFSTIPTQGNFPGRVIILSAAAGGFGAWSMLRYDGSAWATVGGFNAAYTGPGNTNINGSQTSGDLYITNSLRGIVLVDRTTGNKYRLLFNNGILGYEDVS